MTVPSSGDRARRGGRRPGWALLTMLLVLAIAASTALVFTNRVELLKLAVILALWAAVVGAFVSVIYRRQSDVDAARARDLKLVYDLQLDREIAARHEYELNVEANLRRELAGEISARSADEVATLRAELASLRRSLEILFDADLSQRPAIETDRPFGAWSGSAEPARVDRVASSRVSQVRPVPETQTAEHPIIDVPEEPLLTSEPVPPPVPVSRGSHRRPSEDTDWTPPVRPGPVPVVAAPVSQQRVAPVTMPPVYPPSSPPPPPAPVPEPGRSAANGRPLSEPTQPPPVVSEPVMSAPVASPPSPPVVPPQPEPTVPSEPDRRGRHAGAAGEPDGHTSPPPARHRGVDEASAAPAGQSVAELLARLQHDGPVQGGRRRRRED